MQSAPGPEQLELPGLGAVRAPDAPGVARRRPGAVDGVALATTAPVARVALDLQPAHLDRTFDYWVPADLDDVARPGVRVKVRFAGQDVGGYLVERVDASDYEGSLVPLRRVVSAEQVLTPGVLRLARAVADRYAGTLADVLRLAVPPRHARTEQREHAAGPGHDDTGEAPAGPGRPEPSGTAGTSGTSGAAAAAVPRAGAAVPPPHTTDPSTPWAAYAGGEALLSYVAAGAPVRAAWTCLPGPDPLEPAGGHWSAALAELVRAAHAVGRGALVVVPDARDVARLSAALAARGLAPWRPGRGGHVAHLTADDGPGARYAQFLAVLRGDVTVAIGTRAAAFAPVHDLAVAVCWDDTADTHAEPRAPYPHVREVLALRSELEGCAFVVGGHARSTAAQALVRRGWARDVSAPRATVRARTPRVRALTSVELAREGAAASARLPGAALQAVRAALGSGPVLVQVPRAGYVPVVACGRCRTPARCRTCHGPLGLVGPRAEPQCSWCGRLATGWSCAECGDTALRAVTVGSARTAEELGRAFPGVTVRMSGARTGVVDTVPDRPAIVVATPGAEPVAPGGYACAMLLDAAASTGRDGLATGEQALSRWLAAAALVRPGAAGGSVLLVGDAAPAPTGALVRWDPVGFADRELDERAELALPPAVRMASVTGDRTAVTAVVARVPLATGDAVLGPVELDAEDGSLARPVRVLVRTSWQQGRELARQLAASLAVRAAHREGGQVRVQVDPQEIA